MKKFIKAVAAVMCVVLTAVSISACSSPLDEEVQPVAKDDFRVTAYLVGDRFLDPAEIDYSHFSQVTDFIFMSMADFDVNGNIIKAEEFDTAFNNIKPYLPEDANFYVNILGPKSCLLYTSPSPRDCS